MSVRAPSAMIRASGGSVQALILITFLAVARAQPTLVRDIETATNGSSPQSTVAAGRVFFTAFTPSTGLELWSSDGSPGGTALVADLAPGNGSSVPQYLVAIGTTVFFAASAPATGQELRRADGPSTARRSGKVGDNLLERAGTSTAPIVDGSALIATELRSSG